MTFKHLSTKVKEGTCPYCNSLAFQYNIESKWMFLCYNCQRHINIEKVKSNGNDCNHITNNLINDTEFINYNPILRQCEVLSSLPDSHDCIQYVRSRGIPVDSYSRLFYTEKFGDIAAAGQVKAISRFPKMIIPFFDEEGKLFALQARALNGESPKYLTITFNKNKKKIFGQDKTDMNKPFTVVEGPIDSLFLENCVAVAGSDMIDNKYSTLATICLDNERRNAQNIKKLQKYLNNGFKVVIWPDNIKEKDINECILNGINVKKMIEANTYSGLQGKIKLNSWKKI